MFKIIGAGVTVALAAILALACGPTGTGEGQSCGGSTDECGSNLTCTPIQGRGSYCCPAPAESSNYQNCHPVGQTDQTPLH